MANTFPKIINAINSPSVDIPAVIPFSEYTIRNNYSESDNRGSVKIPMAPANFLRHFNVYIQAIDGWTLGYLREAPGTALLPYIPYNTNLDGITDYTLLVNSFVPVPPQNKGVIGLTVPDTDPTKVIEGYFQGSTASHEFELYRIVAIAKNDGSELFLIKVLIQDSPENPNSGSGSDQWKSNVVFETKYFIDITIPPALLNAIIPEEKAFVEFLLTKQKLSR